MSEPTRRPTPKGKPRAKAKAKPKTSARASAARRKAPAPTSAPSDATPARRVMPVYVEPVPDASRPQPPHPVGSPPRPPSQPRPSNGLAVGALVSSIGSFTFVPLIGGVVGTFLGSLALKKEREDRSRVAAGGIAVAAVVIGFFTTLMPLLFITLYTAKDITPIPFVLVAAYSAYVFHTATRGRATTGQKFAIIGGSIVTTAVAIALAIGLAFGFYFLMQAIATEIGRAIGDAFSQMFDGFADAFDGCADAIDF